MTLKEICITKVLPSENKELLKIGYETFYDTYGPPINSEKNIHNYLQKHFTLKQINAELSNPNSVFYFARIQDKIVGYIKLNYNEAQTEFLTGNGLEIERIYVRKESQGKNIGQFLLNKAVGTAQLKQKDFVWLGVWEQNTKALKFYKKHDFKNVDTHQFILGNESQTDIIMKLELKF